MNTEKKNMLKVYCYDNNMKIYCQCYDGNIAIVRRYDGKEYELVEYDELFSQWYCTKFASANNSAELDILDNIYHKAEYAVKLAEKGEEIV